MAAPIGIIGGSGLYRLVDDGEPERLQTPYGPAVVTAGRLAGREVLFLPRHGADHGLAPHRINYRANIWALAALGTRAIVSSAAVGSLDPALRPGTLVLPDQFVDRTAARPDTFFDLHDVQHLPAADPFCPALRDAALDALRAAGEEVRPTGTVVVIQGPRFATRAESRWYRQAGADLINMTLCPEVPLAAELGMGTVNLCLVTDSDAGPDADSAASTADDEPVTAELVFARLEAARPRLLAALGAIVSAVPSDYDGRPLLPRDAIDRVLARQVVSA